MKQELVKACKAVGVIPKDVPADGQFHLADIEGDAKGKGDGRIKIFPDGEGGTVCNWKTSKKTTFFFGDVKNPTKPESQRRKGEHEKAKAEALAARQAEHEQAAKEAQDKWNASKAISKHPYLTKKNVKACERLRVSGSELLVPVYDLDGNVRTLQFISPDGSKRFLKGGAKHGHFFFISEIEDGEPLAIAEGLATGLSVHEATGWPVAVAFDAGNLLPVAIAIRAKYPNAKLVFAADNDVTENGNTGKTKAEEAAEKAGGVVALPDLIEAKSTDWNDVHASQGLDAVRKLLNSELDLPSAENSWGNWGTGTNAPKACNHGEKPAPVNAQDLPQSISKLGQKAGFRVIKATKGQKGGLYFFGDDPEKPVRICGPLEIEADTRDATGKNWGRLLSFPDGDGKVHRWAMPMSLLKADGVELRAELLNRGLKLSNTATARKLLLDYVMDAPAPIKARSVKRTGWHERAFVLTDQTIGEQDGEKVFFQSQSLEGLGFTQAGTLEGWRNEVCEPCAGNSRLVLALSAAFAAMTLGLVGAESGGLHFRGPSSCGKTTALRVAASVFSEPGYLRTFRSTDNALEGACTAHSDLCLILDELGQLDPKHAGQVAYLLANGQAKGRASRDGNAREIATWRLLFLSTGEVGLADLVNEAGADSKAGHEVRVIDLQADANVGLGIFERVPDGLQPAKFSDALKRASATHYGHAMPAFVSRLAQDFEALAAKLRTMQEDFVESVAKTASAGQVRRVAARFGLIAAAGEFATAWGLTGWPEDEAINACKKCFQEWLATRGTAGDREPAAMLARVRAFLEQHGDSRFTDWENGSDRVMINRVTINRMGFRKAWDGGTEYYVLAESFKKELAKGCDVKQLTKLLLSNGALMPDSEGNATRKERLPELGNQRVYRITTKIWEGTV